MSTSRMDALDHAFSPSAPITSQDFFLGRLEQLGKAVDAINQRGQHIAVFGERGVGKTSFTNILQTQISNLVISKVTCNREDDFKGVWTRALSKVSFSKESAGIGFVPQKGKDTNQLNLFLPEKENIDSLDIQITLERVNSHLLFIFDEFDSVQSDLMKVRFADTIKNLSDNAPKVTIALVGIASDVTDLIGYHPSIERCVRQIPMPRMSADELRAIVEKGLDLLEMGMNPTVLRRIVFFSSGFPHFTHLLAKYSARQAIIEGVHLIQESHYRQALSGAIEDTNQSIRHAYQFATIDVKQRKSRFEQVISGCALAVEDEYGTFAIKDVVPMYNKVTGESLKAGNLVYNVKKLCEPERGAILLRVGDSNNVRFRFSNPLMRVYARMKLDHKNSARQPDLFV